MKFFEEIRKQPPHIRELFMWLCVVITFSIISFAWFRSTTHQFVALLNPQGGAEETNRALADARQQSAFETISQSVSVLRASFFDIFSIKAKPASFDANQRDIYEKNNPIPPSFFPPTGQK